MVKRCRTRLTQARQPEGLAVEVVVLLEVVGRVERLEFAVVDHHEPVAAVEGGEPVGDDDDRHLVAQPVECLADQVLGAHVERTGRLVEDQHVGVFDERSGDDQALLLAAAQVAAAFADLTVVAVGERDDIVVQVGQSGWPVRCRPD